MKNIENKIDKILSDYGVDWKISESNGKGYYLAFRRELLETIYKEVDNK